MIKKLLALLISAIMGLSGTTALSVNDILDQMGTMLFGLPVTAQGVEDSFFEKLTENSVNVIDEENGFINNHVVLILNSKANILKKFVLFKSEGLKAVGWAAPAEIYVASCHAESFSDVLAKCERLESYDEVELAMPLTVGKTENSYTPNDPFLPVEENGSGFEWNELNPYGTNWWLEAINARGAWDYKSYFKDVWLGILDDGVNYYNPEISDKLYFANRREFTKTNFSFHGTHVCGIVGAAMDNNMGVAGVSPNAKMIFSDWYPAGFQMWNTTISPIFGYIKLVKAGAKAVNMSFGMSGNVPAGGSKNNSLSWRLSIMLSSYTMASLLSKGYDFLVIQAAGNGNASGVSINTEATGFFCGIKENMCFTGGYDLPYNTLKEHILSVGAAQNSRRNSFKYTLGKFSNNGSGVEIAAPGVGVYSTYYDAYDMSKALEDECYDYLTGTSMAAPVVTGVAGLIWGINSKFTAKEVKNIIINSTKDMCYAEKDPNNSDFSYCGVIDDIENKPMVNAQLCVEEALRKTYGNMGEVTGEIQLNGQNANDLALCYGDNAYTILPDGTFDFVSPEGSGTVFIKDANGTVLYSEEISIVRNSTVNVNFAKASANQSEAL